MKGMGEKEEMTERDQGKDLDGRETLHVEIQKIIVNIEEQNRKMILRLIRVLKQKTREFW